MGWTNRSSAAAVDDGDRDDADEVGDEDAPRSARKKAEKGKAEAKARSREDASADRKSRSSDEALGPNFEKRMEALGERIGKEMEKKFGPDTDFAREMKALGDQLAREFGPGSDFDRKMKDFERDKGRPKSRRRRGTPLAPGPIGRRPARRPRRTRGSVPDVSRRSSRGSKS